jgi:hypothetical protein
VSSVSTGSSPDAAGRESWLQSTWTRAALVVAGVEAILIVFGVLPRWVAVGIALGLLVLYFTYGRKLGNPSARQASWAVALSQGLVLLVPLLLWIVNAALVVLLAVAAVAVVVLVARDR